MVCQFLLYNKMSQLYVYIYPHIPSLLHLPPTLPIPPIQVVTKHRPDLPVLCGCFPLAVLHLVVYICPCHSLTSSQLTLPLPVCSSPFSTSASLFLSCPQVLQNHFFQRCCFFLLLYTEYILYYIFTKFLLGLIFCPTIKRLHQNLLSNQATYQCAEYGCSQRFWVLQQFTPW